MTESESVLELKGNVDMDESMRLYREACALPGEGDVRISCAQLESLHSAALQILLALRTRLANQGRRLFIDPAPGLCRMLAVAGISQDLFGCAR